MNLGLVAEFPEVLVTRKDFPARTLKDFVAYAKANQSKLNITLPALIWANWPMIGSQK